MNSLGVKPKTEDCLKAPCCPSDSDEPNYPTMCLNGDQMKAFLGKMRLEPGTVYEVPIQFKVEGFSDRKWGKSLDLCVLSSGTVVKSGEEPPEPEDEEKEESDPVVAAVGYGA